jgi:hypothetical protein
MDPDPAARLGQRGRGFAAGDRFGLTVAESVRKAQARKIRVRFIR